MAELNSTVKKEQHKENQNETIDIQDEFMTTGGNVEGLREVQQT